METFAEIIFLGIVQGAAEFLPISSSGHLVLSRFFLGIEEPKLFLDIVLHLGTLCAVVVMFFPLLRDCVVDGWACVRGKILFRESHTKLAVYACVGCIPAVIAVLFFKDTFEAAFSKPAMVAILLIINGFILLASRFGRRHDRGVGDFTVWHALIIGCAQCIAIFPGISRSGTTITCALLCGISPILAFRFSFLLAIPAIVGATVLECREVTTLSSGECLKYGVGFLVAAAVGYVSLLLLQRFVAKNRLHYFTVYCWIVGLISLCATWYVK